MKDFSVKCRRCGGELTTEARFDIQDGKQTLTLLIEPGHVCAGDRETVQGAAERGFKDRGFPRQGD